MDSNNSHRHRPSIRGCLKALGIDCSKNSSDQDQAQAQDQGDSATSATTTTTAFHIFGHCKGDLALEFKALKRVYFRKILREHPDKGGDPAIFRKSQAAFEILRERHLNNNVDGEWGGGVVLFSFLDVEELDADDRKVHGNRNDSVSGNDNDNDNDNSYDYDSDEDEEYFRKEAERAKAAGGAGVPSYEYYYEAAQQEMPGYRVELAKSNRSRCVKCNANANTATKKKKKISEKDEADPTTTTTASAIMSTSLVVPAIPVTTTGRRTRAMTRALALAATTTATATSTSAKAKTKTSKKKAVTKKATTTTTTTAVAAHIATAPSDTSLIPKDGIRVGSLNEMAGSYGRWHHLPCWRVPYRVWAGLTDPNCEERVWQDLLQMDEILLTNVSSLVATSTTTSNSDNKTAFVRHVMDRTNWARKTKRSKAPPDLERLRHEQEEKMKMMMMTTGDNTVAVSNSVVKKEKTAVKKEKKVAAVKKEKKTTKKKKPSSSSALKKRSAPKSDYDNGNDDGDRKPAAKSSKKAKTAKGTSTATVTATATDIVVSSSSTTEVATAASSSSAALVRKQQQQGKKKKKFTIPRPGVDGAAAANLYQGKRFVLTGTFPEIGGGMGLDLGKEKARSLIESFGGRVTSAVSGKTDYLLVGKSPGQSKVRQADAKGTQRVQLKSICDQIYGTIEALEQAPVPVITNFSAGYQGGSYSRRIGYY